MVRTAMHDAVADSRQPIATKMSVGKFQQCVEGDGERKRGTCRPASLGQYGTGGVTGEKARRCI
jgi:hypothetical protein